MKRVALVAAAAFALAVPLMAGQPAEAQTEPTPGVCPTIYVAFAEDTVVALTLNFLTTAYVTVRQPSSACPNGTEDEAVDDLIAQIRTGVIDSQDFNGKRRLVPPSRVTAYVLPSAYLPRF